jgi:hypothetical protein
LGQGIKRSKVHQNWNLIQNTKENKNVNSKSSEPANNNKQRTFGKIQNVGFTKVNPY